MKEAVKFLRGLDMPDGLDPIEFKKAIRQKFMHFCKETGHRNTIEVYRMYSSAVAAEFGFVLPKQRPTRWVDPIELQMVMDTKKKGGLF